MIRGCFVSEKTHVVEFSNFFLDSRVSMEKFPMEKLHFFLSFWGVEYPSITGLSKWHPVNRIGPKKHWMFESLRSDTMMFFNFSSCISWVATWYLTLASTNYQCQEFLCPIVTSLQLRWETVASRGFSCTIRWPHPPILVIFGSFLRSVPKFCLQQSCSPWICTKLFRHDDAKVGEKGTATQ